MRSRLQTTTLATYRASTLGRMLALLNIQPGEGRRVAWMMLYSAAATGGVSTVGIATASALFLSELSASATPFIFIGCGAAGVVTFLLYSIAASRVPGDQLVLGTQVLLLAIVLILWLLLGTPAGNGFVLLLTLFLFADAGSVLIIAQFWVRAAQVFDPREAKRLFGPMAAGGTAASVLAGLALQAGTGAAIGMKNLLLVVAISIAVCIICTQALRRLQCGIQGRVAVTTKALPKSGAQLREDEDRRFVEDLRAIGRTPLLLLIAGLTILTALTVNTVYYQWYLAVQKIYAGRSQELVAFLGGYESIVAVAALFVQLGLTSRIMRRLGVFAALLVLPLAMALSEVLVLASGGALLAIALARSGDPVFRFTINNSAMTVLYLPVPAGLRRRARMILEIAYAFSFALLGIGFLASQRRPAWTYITWAVLALGFVAAWVVLWRWGRPQYSRALAENLKKRRLDFANATIDITDQATVQVLVDALASPDELLVVHTLDLIGQAPKVDWTPHIAPLLKHPSPDVCILALRRLGLARASQYREAVAALLTAAEADVRAAAVEASSVIGGPDMTARIAPLLGDASPAVRGAALIALGQHGGPEWTEPVEDGLTDLLGNADPASLNAAAGVIAALGRPEHAPLLTPLLIRTTPPNVRASAIRAAPALRSHALLAPLIGALGDTRVAADAGEALVRYGRGSLGVGIERSCGIEHDLAVALDDAGLLSDHRSRIPQVLSRLQTPAATAVLIAHLREPDEVVRAAVYAALMDLTPLPASSKDGLNGALSSEIHNYYTHYIWRADLAALTDGSLLGEALAARLSRSLDRICLLLGVLYPGGRVAGLRQALDGDRGKRALAIEMLDTLLTGEANTLLIQALEAPADQVLSVAGKRLGIKQAPASARLAEFAAGNDPWLRACALHQLEDQGGDMTLSTIERVLLLKSADLFGRLSSEDLAPVAQRAQEVHFQAGETFVRQDDPGDCMYVIVDGQASIVQRGVGQIGTRGPKSTIGEMAIIRYLPRSADCVALTDITALQIEHDDFWELMIERPVVAQGVIKVLAQRLDEATVNLQKVRLKQ